MGHQIRNKRFKVVQDREEGKRLEGRDFSGSLPTEFRTQQDLQFALVTLLGACMPYVSESHIRASARDIARFVWRLGFRFGRMTLIPRKISSACFVSRRWRIMFVNYKKYYGHTDQPRIKHKTIRLKKNMTGIVLLDTAIHEALHACLWDLNEDAVWDSASDIARFLTKTGLRKC